MHAQHTAQAPLDPARGEPGAFRGFLKFLFLGGIPSSIWSRLSDSRPGVRPGLDFLASGLQNSPIIGKQYRQGV